MPVGLAPQAFVTLFEEEWLPTRPYREPVPDVVDDPDTESGVLVVRNKSDANVRQNIHDLLHVYYPTAGGITRSDKGFDEEGVVEEMQIDLQVADRPLDFDPFGGDRIGIERRLFGFRTAANRPQEYGGLVGEVWHVLSSVRRGYQEYDKVDFDILTTDVGNSEAVVSFEVQAEIITQETVN